MVNHENPSPPKDAGKEKPVDFLQLIKQDYGITKVGENEYQVILHGVLFTGSLASVISTAKGEPPGIWGNP